MTGSNPPVDQELITAYSQGRLDPLSAAEIDARVLSDPAMQAAVGATADAQRLSRTWSQICLQVDVPPLARSERMLRRIGVPASSARLIAATPVVRRAWFIAMAVTLFFALSVGDSQGDDTRLLLLLALAPVLPVAGVALAYGPTADPTHELLVSTPLHGLRLVLLRTVAVVTATSAMVGVFALLGGAGGWLRLGWLIPSLALTVVTLVIASWVGHVRAAIAVVGLWLAAVGIIALAASDSLVAFRVPGQVVYALLGAVATFVLVRRRDVFELGEADR